MVMMFVPLLLLMMVMNLHLLLIAEEEDLYRTAGFVASTGLKI